MSRIENWFRRQLIMEIEDPGPIPNLILLPFAIYYYIKWSCEFEQ